MRTGQRAAHGAALLYVLSAAAALACPTAADLDATGVRFIGNEGESVLHTRIDARRTQSDWSYAGDDYISRTVLIHGVYLEVLEDIAGGVIDPDTRGVITRPVAIEALPLPEPGLSWTTTQVYRDSIGPLQETLTMTVGDAGKLTLGGCEYEVYPIIFEVAGSDETYTEEVTYFPSLGTGVLVAVNDGAGRFTYDYSDIAVEPAQ